jgi:hypothetical protein
MMLLQAFKIQKHTVHCPWCGQDLLHVYPNDFEVVGRTFWLSDGDAIPGLMKSLSHAQKTPDAFFCDLTVGHCHACDRHYYAIETSFIHNNIFPMNLDAYLQFLEDMPDFSNYICAENDAEKDVESSWYLTAYPTPCGEMHQHTIGPFKLEDSMGVISDNGVNACQATAYPWQHARDLVLRLWDGLREMNATERLYGGNEVVHE